MSRDAALTLLDVTALQGTRASTIFRQSEKYIAPLLKHFKAKDTPPELVPMLAQICKCMEQREYQNANDMCVAVLPVL